MPRYITKIRLQICLTTPKSCEINKMVNKNAIKHCKELLLRIPLKGNEEGDMHIYDFHSLLNHPTSHQYFTSNDERCSNYTYTIDFDTNKFISFLGSINERGIRTIQVSK